MKMHNFTIRGNFLEIVGRVVNNGAKNPVTVYDLYFPCDMENMSLDELREVTDRIREDIDNLFYFHGAVRNDEIRNFDEAWRTGVEDDAHGA